MYCPTQVYNMGQLRLILGARYQMEFTRMPINAYLEFRSKTKFAFCFKSVFITQNISILKVPTIIFC